MIAKFGQAPFLSLLRTASKPSFVSVSWHSVYSKSNNNILHYEEIVKNNSRAASIFMKTQSHNLTWCSPLQRITFSSTSDANNQGSTNSALMMHPSLKLTLKCLELDSYGNIKKGAREHLKSDLCAQHGLQPRDLRTIDASFKGLLSAILVRSNAIVVHLAHIKAIIKADGLLLFDPPRDFENDLAQDSPLSNFVPLPLPLPLGSLTFAKGASSLESQYPSFIPTSSLFIYDLQERLRLTSSANTSEDATSMSPARLPFEFRALEAILISACHALHDEFMLMSQPILAVLKTFEENESTPLQHDKLKELLRLSKRLTKFDTKIDHVRGAIMEILNSDADMVDMYLSEKLEFQKNIESNANSLQNSNSAKDSDPLPASRPVTQHEEVELLLETYLKQVDEIASQSGELISNIKTTEDIINITLDAQRNRVLLLELKLTMGGLALATGGIVAAVFGMNLFSSLEQHPNAFYTVVCFLSATIVTTFTFLMRRMKWVFKV